MLALFVFFSFEFQLQLVHHQQHWHRQPHPVSITAISGPLYNKQKWTTVIQKSQSMIHSSSESNSYVNQDAKRLWLTQFLNDWNPSSLITPTTVFGVHSKFWLRYGWKSYQFPYEEIVVSKC